MRYGADSEEMASFVVQVDTVNAAAENSPGFVWRIQSDAGNAMDIRIFDDDRLLFNMSVWESVEALKDFTYKSVHSGPFRDRARWFEPPSAEEPTNVLWWVPAGHRPTTAEAEERFRNLWRDGPAQAAFTFGATFPAPETSDPAGKGRP